jgi:hypothetical protein
MDAMNATKRHCVGCRDNFYNGNNTIGVSECWLLKEAEIVTRYRLSIHTPMSQRSGYAKVRVPNCYHERGYVHMKAIPEYAK